MAITFLIKEVLEKFEIKSFVETGIGEGSTTPVVVKAFSDLKVKDYEISEVECHLPYCEALRQRYKDNKRVKIYNEMSEDFLKREVATPKFSKDRTLFYLDAHAWAWNNWEGSYPVNDELRWILKLRNKPIIVIDDFQNPYLLYKTGYITTEQIYPYVRDRVDSVWHCMVRNEHLAEVQCVAILFIDEDDKVVAEKLEGLPFKPQSLKFFDRRRALV